MNPTFISKNKGAVELKTAGCFKPPIPADYASAGSGFNAVVAHKTEERCQRTEQALGQSHPVKASSPAAQRFNQ
jgi:hypothetical protein